MTLENLKLLSVVLRIGIISGVPLKLSAHEIFYGSLFLSSDIVLTQRLKAREFWPNLGKKEMFMLEYKIPPQCQISMMMTNLPLPNLVLLTLRKVVPFRQVGP